MNKTFYTAPTMECYSTQVESGFNTSLENPDVDPVQPWQ